MAKRKNGGGRKRQVRGARKTSLKGIRGVQQGRVKRLRKAGYGRTAKLAQAQVKRFAKDGKHKKHVGGKRISSGKDAYKGTPMEKIICEAMKNEGFRSRVIHYVARKLV